MCIIDAEGQRRAALPWRRHSNALGALVALVQVHVRPAHPRPAAVDAHARVHGALVVFVLVLLAESDAEPTRVAAGGGAVQAVLFVGVNGAHNGVTARLDLRAINFKACISQKLVIDNCMRHS